MVKKIITGRSVFYQIFLEYIKGICKHISEYFEQFLFRYQCGFRNISQFSRDLLIKYKTGMYQNLGWQL